MKTVAAVAVLLCSLHLPAQAVPDAPSPQFDRVDWALLATDAGGRALDTYSTSWSLDRGNREKFLPGFIANHTGRLAVFEGGIVGLNYFAARSLVRHRHRKLARLMMVADSLQVWPWAIRNLTMPDAAR